MKLNSLYVTAFGRLADFEYKFSDGLNIVKEDNGFGKSTLASFVKAVLYGFDYARKGADRANDTDYFTPWDSVNKRYGGYLVYTDSGKKYKLERYFGSTAKQEQVCLTMLETGQILDSSDIGKRLTGLSADAFAQSTFIPQEKISVVNSADFVQKLSGMLDCDNDQNSLDRAMEGLRNYSKQFKLERGQGGQIFELSNQVNKLEYEIAKSKSNLLRAEQLAAECQQLNSQSKELREQSKQLEKQISNLNSDIALSDNSHTENLKNQLLETKSRLAKKDFSNIQKDSEKCQQLLQASSNTKQYKLFGAITAVLSVVLAVVAVVLFVESLVPAAIVLSVLAVPSTAVFAYLSSLQRKEKKREADQKSLLKDILARYVFVEDDLAQSVKKLWQMHSEYQVDLAKIALLSDELKGTDNSAQHSKREQLKICSDNLEYCRNRLSQVQFETGQKQQEQQSLTEANDVNALLGNLEQKRESLQQAQYKYDVAQQTIELLRQARENLSNAYLPKLAQTSSQLLQAFSNGRFSQVVVDKEFNCDLVENHVRKPLKYFSRGIREITAFCFRIALSQLLYGTIDFLLLDDTFVNLDEANFLAGVKMLQDMSTQTQIVYFTCHDRIKWATAV